MTKKVGDPASSTASARRSSASHSTRARAILLGSASRANQETTSGENLANSNGRRAEVSVTATLRSLSGVRAVENVHKRFALGTGTDRSITSDVLLEASYRRRDFPLLGEIKSQRHVGSASEKIPSAIADLESSRFTHDHGVALILDLGNCVSPGRLNDIYAEAQSRHVACVRAEDLLVTSSRRDNTWLAARRLNAQVLIAQQLVKSTYAELRENGVAYLSRRQWRVAHDCEFTFGDGYCLICSLTHRYQEFLTRYPTFV